MPYNPNMSLFPGIPIMAESAYPDDVGSLAGSKKMIFFGVDNVASINLTHSLSNYNHYPIFWSGKILVREKFPTKTT